MFIKFFKGNHPFVLLAVLPVVILVFWMPLFFKPTDIILENPMPLFAVLLGVFGEYKLLSVIVAALVLYLQGVLLNTYVNKFELLPERTNLVGLFYVILMSSFLSYLTLHPAIFSNLFLILAFRKICSIYRQDHVFSAAFDASFLLSVGSLFYFPTIVFFPITIIALAVIRPFSWREHVISIIGLLLPYVFVGSFYFLSSKFHLFFNEVMQFSKVEWGTIKANIENSGLLGVFIIILTIMAIPRILNISSQSVVRTQNLLKVIFGCFTLALLGGILFSGSLTNIFSIFVIPISIFIANYFLTNRRIWISELLFLVYTGAVFYNHFF